MLSMVQPCLAAKKPEAVKDDLKEVHEKIESLKKELDASKDAHKDAADALRASETAISQAQKKLHEINQQQQQNSATLNTLKKQSLTLNQKLAEQQKRLSQQLYQQYLHGNPSYTQLILENKDPNAIARDLKYYSYIAKARSQLIAGMQSNLTKIESLNQETAATLEQVSALKAKQEAEKKALEEQKREKANVVKSLSQQIAMQRNEISKLKRDEKNLSQLVEKIAKQAAAREEAAKKKKLANARSKKQKKIKQPPADDSNPTDSPTPSDDNQVVAKNERLPEDDFGGVQFSTLKGKLRLPVRGDVSNRFGATRADTGVSWKGLFIKSSEGNEVKAVASGRVVFADWMRGFGNLIIVDHGSGYMSLYGNNQALIKAVGERVNGGDTIASVGNSGGNESHGLYYELRRNSVPFDPLSWSRLH
jgi:murein hydrolase activator